MRRPQEIVDGIVVRSPHVVGMALKPKVIVVAEDEALIRMVAVEALTEAGFDVIEAQHAEDALGILQAKADEIDLLFTDIHMPGIMNGLDLAHYAQAHWPWIALLVSSGKARPHKTTMPQGSRFLPKPYRSSHMVHHVRTLIVDRNV
jgi:CheY-like chemotaxis protein